MVKPRFKLTGELNDKLIPCFEYPNCNCKGHFIWEDNKFIKENEGGKE